MLIDIVTHCYARKLPIYAQLFCYQLSSLVNENGLRLSNDVRMVACVSKKDTFTRSLITWFMEHTDLRIVELALDEKLMTKRCIGRNTAALESKADFVWFADCDQTFEDNILEEVPNLDWDDTLMYYPKTIMIHKDHATGDEYARRVLVPKIYKIDKADFIPKSYNRAIGGVQIVTGDFAREHGYLKTNEKWQTPRENAAPFSRNCFDDRSFRSEVAELGNIRGTELPGTFRLRHSKSGRGDDKN